jgi:hypothetical protein
MSELVVFTEVGWAPPDHKLGRGRMAASHPKDRKQPNTSPSQNQGHRICSFPQPILSGLGLLSKVPSFSWT